MEPAASRAPGMKNQVQLIAYVDRFSGGGLLRNYKE